ncbi:MAG: DegV family protein, partial [Acidobacteriota bacterium]
RDPSQPVPTTSQAPPGAFAEAYRRCFEAGSEEVLGIFLSGAVSGTLGSARTAAGRIEGDRVRVVDSRSGSLGLGMQVIRAVELLDEGRSAEAVAREIERIREQANVYFTVKDLEGLLRSGRVSRGRAWLADLLDLRPVLKLDGEGHVVPHARVRGEAGAREAMMTAVDEALEGSSRYRLGVVHAGVPELARSVADEVRRRWAPVQLSCRPLTPVIAAHLGAGAWGLCYQIED